MPKTQRHRSAPPHDAYPLRTVAAMTGLTPDLIRAWEKRYAVVTPVRGARGARLYTAADIAHLRLLARVVTAGRAIGDVAPLPAVELEKLAALEAPGGRRSPTGGAVTPAEQLISEVLEQLGRFDHAAVARLLGGAVVGLGVRAFVHEVAAPLVRRVGTCWQGGELSIAAEHLLTATLRSLLGGLMQERARTGPLVLLATPAGERHEIGLLLVALLCLDAGADVLYLGSDLPATDIVTAARRPPARVVGLSLVTANNRAHAVREVEAVQRGLPATIELWLGGADARHVVAHVKAGRGVVMDDLRSAETALARISPIRLYA